MTLLSQATSRLEVVLNEVRSVTSEIRFLTASRQHLITSALLATILEISEGIHASLVRDDGTSAFILFRSLLEAYVDLLNSAKDPDYGEYMDAAFLEQRRRILVSVIERGSRSPFLRGIAENPNSEESLASIRTELDRLKGRGVKRLSVRDRFERAGQLDYYQGPYANLCWHSHNNINVLEERHLRNDHSGLRIVVGKSLTDSNTQIIVDTTAGISFNSIVAASNLVEDVEPSYLEGLRRSVDELRSLWSGGT